MTVTKMNQQSDNKAKTRCPLTHTFSTFSSPDHFIYLHLWQLTFLVSLPLLLVFYT